MHIRNPVYGHFLYICISIVIYNLWSILFIISVFITLIIWLHYVCTVSSQHQDEFLVCVNMLGNKALSDFLLYDF